MTPCWRIPTPCSAAGPGDGQTDFIHYGAGYLFLSYLAQHYGGYDILRKLLTSPEQEPLNVDAALAASGTKDRFNDVFGKYVLEQTVERCQQRHGHNLILTSYFVKQRIPAAAIDPSTSGG